MHHKKKKKWQITFDILTNVLIIFKFFKKIIRKNFIEKNEIYNAKASSIGTKSKKDQSYKTPHGRGSHSEREPKIKFSKITSTTFFLDYWHTKIVVLLSLLINMWIVQCGEIALKNNNNNNAVGEEMTENHKFITTQSSTFQTTTAADSSSKSQQKP